MQKLEAMQDSSTTFIWCFALFWNGIIGCVGFGIFFVARGENMQGVGTTGILVLIPFLIIGVIFLLLAFRSGLARYKAPKAQFLISGNPLMLGDQFTVNYQQKFRGGATLNSIRYDLIFKETSTYTQGTNTYTVHHDVVMNTYEVPAQRLGGREPLQTQFNFQIPPTAMHSFHAENNKLRWIIRTKIDIQGWPNYEREYELTILPMKREQVSQGFA